MDDRERIENLQRAHDLLVEASSLIEESIDMTDRRRRFSCLPERIRDLADSDSEESVTVLLREMDYSGEEQPGWTRWNVSVKNIVRKDI